MLTGVMFLVVLVIALTVALVVLIRRADPARRAQRLRLAGFILMALFTAMFAVFVVGETIADPGGWKAAGLIGAWVVPLAALAALAWWRPDWAVRGFAVLAGAMIGLSIWFAVSPEWWRSLEDRNGPIRAVVTFVLTAAIAVLGLKRTAPAGVLLLVTGIAPAAISGIGSRLGLTSLAVVSVVPVATGLCYLIAARMPTRPSPPAQVGTEPTDLPRAA